MKKFLSILLTVLLLASQTGVHAQTHYCMDRLTHFSIFAIEEHENLCACNEAYEESGCCKDVEVHEQHNPEATVIFQLNPPLVQDVLAFGQGFFSVRTENPNSGEAFTQMAEEVPQWLRCWEITNLRI